ncbi:MAG: hypothetical protein EKK64_01795 [Neisseriaceae bacterium]|nr:MAG: hypothetical protein EKK64_01795 [Neisseriaceae bacterium]
MRKELKDFDCCKVLKPIFADVSSNGQDYISCFKEANISASGNTAEEAIENLKDIVQLKFLRLTETEELLGNPLKSQLKSLQKFLSLKNPDGDKLGNYLSNRW